MFCSYHLLIGIKKNIFNIDLDISELLICDQIMCLEYSSFIYWIQSSLNN